MAMAIEEMGEEEREERNKAREEGEVGSGGGELYEFRHVPFTSALHTDRSLKEAWMRWNMDELTRITRFSFGRRFEVDNLQAFLLDVFNSPEVRTYFHVVSRSKAPVALTERIDRVDAEKLRATVTSLAFFDRFMEADVVTEDGYIRKCMDEVVEGTTVADHLKAALLLEESEHFELFSEDEKREFLFQLFKRVVTGGALCQWDDSWNEYLAVVRALYKELLSVQKNPHTGELEVTSFVFRIHALRGEGARGNVLFPEDNAHNACFLCVDARRRQATILYAPFVPFW